MSQIAQQDHLYVHIGDIENITNTEKAELLQKVKNGTILDTILVVELRSNKSFLSDYSRPIGGL